MTSLYSCECGQQPPMLFDIYKEAILPSVLAYTAIIRSIPCINIGRVLCSPNIRHWQLNTFVSLVEIRQKNPCRGYILHVLHQYRHWRIYANQMTMTRWWITYMKYLSSRGPVIVCSLSVFLFLLPNSIQS
jgi:hypothetical protein